MDAPMRDATVVDLYNASMNGWFIIDTPFWELPDDPRVKLHANRDP
jgi:hypothetical protein